MGGRAISRRSTVVVGMSLSLLSVRVDRRRADGDRVLDDTVRKSKDGAGRWMGAAGIRTLA
jgi:hypothetical protein